MYLQISTILGRKCVRLGITGVVVGGAIASFSNAFVFGSIAIAQVVADPTLGSVVNDTGGNVQTITGGTTRETNLFHSFDRFSVPTNGTAFFDNAANIQNILTRVTGSSRSDIDGLIRANGAANLFLLNPNGIVFGQNARLDIGGSFIATTASSINFANGTQFSATPDPGAPLLTVSVPLGLQFGSGAGEIVNRASNEGLQVNTGKTLGLIGGNVNLEGGRLTAAGGRIELGAVAAPGVVGLNTDGSGFRFSFPTDLVLGNISLTANTSVSPSSPALVDVRAGNGGSITVNTRNLNLTGGGAIVAGIGTDLGATEAVAGDIDINAQGTVVIDGVGRFPNGVFSSGIFNNVNEGGTGKGGNINLKANSLSLTDRGVISASVFGTGDAGNVDITAADRVSLDSSTIFNSVQDIGRGNGGNITLKARSLSLSNGAQLSAPTLGQGNAGSIQVNVRDDLSVSGGSFLQAVSFSTGNAGDVSITSGGPVFFDGDGSDILTSLSPIPAFQGERRGGNINIRARSLSLSNNASLTTATLGQGNAGNIQIDTTDSVIINSGASLNTFSSGAGNAGAMTITSGDRVALDGVGTDDLPSGAFSFLLQNSEFAGDPRGGDINIKARSLSLTNGAKLSADSQRNAGNINVDVSDTVSIDGIGTNNLPSEISSTLLSNGRGKGGDINIKARSLFLTNGGSLTTSTSGQGNAGSIYVTATDPNNSVSFSGGSFIESSSSNTGNAGNVEIAADGNFSLDTNSYITSSLNEIPADSIGQIPPVPSDRKGGDISIKARSLDLSNGAELNASTSGQGNAGNVFVQVDDSVNLTNSSYIFSTVEPGAVGNGGKVDVKANSLLLKDGAQIQALVRGTSDTLPGGRGNAGSVNIISNTFTATGIDRNGIRSGVFNYLDSGAVGKGGNINVKVGSLSLDNAELSASTFGQGNAGNVFVQVDGSINLANSSYILSTVGIEGIGNGGEIDINARTLSLTDGAQITAATFGQGNAGNTDIDVSDTISFQGASSNGFLSGVFSNVEQGGKGNGGNITLKARSLSLTNGGQITAATFSQGNAGNIDIDVSDTISFAGADNSDCFCSGVFSTVEQGGIGNGGNIALKARSLSLTNGGQLNASNVGQGNAGNIIVDIRTLNLDRGRIFASSKSGNSGDILLQASKSVRLRNNSLISTSTGSGNGGNITINTPLVLAEFQGNNDIFANAFDGEGGEIKINAQSIFGLRQRTSEELQPELQRRFGTDTPTTQQLQEFLSGLVDNDVAAISLNNPALSGTVSFNADYIDPSRDIVELPTGLVDASGLVAAGCPSGAENRFTVTGRGGLPPAPGDKLSSEAILTDWATLQTPETANRAAVKTTTSVATYTTNTPVIEATSWQFDRNGAIILTSGDATATNHFEATPTSCPSS